jgi:hypothetical protein
VDIGGVVLEVQDVYNVTEILVDEFIILRPGNNTISIIVEDMAGNQQISTIFYITPEDIETSSTPINMIFLPIITLVIIRRSKK